MSLTDAMIRHNSTIANSQSIVDNFSYGGGSDFITSVPIPSNVSIPVYINEQDAIFITSVMMSIDGRNAISLIFSFILQTYNIIQTMIDTENGANMYTHIETYIIVYYKSASFFYTAIGARVIQKEKNVYFPDLTVSSSVSLIPYNLQFIEESCYSADSRCRKYITHLAIGDSSRGAINDYSRSNLAEIRDYAFLNCIKFEGFSDNLGLTIPQKMRIIGIGAFQNCPKIKAIRFLNTNSLLIGDYAFEKCIGLKSLNINSNIDSIGDYAFKNCTGLTSLNINSNIDSIGDYAFQGCTNLTSININSYIGNIGNNAFENCTNLRRLNIKSGVGSIGNDAFNGCINLTEIIFSYNGNDIGENVFKGVPFTYEDVRTMLYNSSGELTKKELIKWGFTELAVTKAMGSFDLTVDENNTLIRSESFWMDISNEVIIMSNKPNNTFSYTYKIGNIIKTFDVILPNGMYTIDEINDYLEYTMRNNGTYLFDANGNAVFYINLKTFKTLAEVVHIIITTYPQLTFLPTGWQSPPDISGDILALSTTRTNPTITFSGNIIHNLGLQNNFTSGQGLSIFNNGKFTHSYSFLGAYNYIYLPSFININSHSFDNIRTELTDIIIPNNSVITSIPSNTFLNCIKLTNYSIGNNIKNINDNAFEGCISLTRLLIPSSVTSLGNGIFKKCDGLTYIDETNLLSNIVGANMFDTCIKLTSVLLSNGISSVGDYAFNNCTSLSYVEIKNTNDFAFTAAFAAADAAAAVAAAAATAADAATSAATNAHAVANTLLADAQSASVDDAIRSYEVYYDAHLAAKDADDDATIARSYAATTAAAYVVALNAATANASTAVSNINPIFGNFCFSNCSNLTNVTVRSSISVNKINITFKSGSFQNCVKLKNIVNIVDNVATYQISDYMFYGCTDLTNVIIPEFVTSIGNNSFQGCSKINNFVIQNSVKNIESNIFDSCSGLTNITGANLLNDTISDYMFNNCVNLTSVVIPNNITSIGKYSFSSCTNLKNITIPCNLILDDTLFYNCNNITLTISSGVGVNSFSVIDNYLNNTRNITRLIISPSITSIGSNAFANCIDITKIVIPSNIVSGGSGIFEGCVGLSQIDETNLQCISIFERMFYGCIGLTNVIIPSYINSISTSAFMLCNGLTNITESNILNTIIGDNMFDSCTSLTNIVIPSRVTSIGSGAFKECTRLTSITESNILNTIIGANMFNSCTGLTNVIIPSRVTEIGSGAFQKCTSLTSITSSNILNTIIGANMFDSCTGLTNVIIPSGVTEIGSGAFQKCTRLTSITNFNILNKVIGANMFDSCTGITNVIIPPQVTDIGSEAFRLCTGLISITESNILNEVIGQRMFTSCSGLKNVIIPSQVTSIGDAAFTGNPFINNIEFKNAVIGANMFFGNNFSLTVLTIPSSITSIGSGAFAGFNELKTINFQNNMIGDYMFSSCYHLYTIRIPISVTSIGISAFQGCYNLLNINLYRNFTNSPSLTILGKDSFKKTDSNIYHFGSLRGLISAGYTIGSLLDAGFDYDAVNKARGDIKSTVVDNVITNLFYSNYTDGILVFPNNATSMNQSTINKIQSLYINEIYFGYIFNLNFNNLLSNFPILKKVYLNNITILGDYLFSGCTSITSITLPDTLTSIGGYAFQGCTGLKNITIPSSVISIGEHIFKGCTSLTSITIPSSIMNISNYACQGCTSLKSINLPSTVTNVGNYAFQGCTSLISIIIPLNVTNVGEYAFQSCSNLTNFIIERDFMSSSLTTLGYNCFANCNLLDIYCFFELFSDGYSKVSISNTGFPTINKVLNLTVVDGVLTDFPNQTIDPNAILCIPNNVSSISNTLNTTNNYSSVKNSLNTIYFTKNNIITDIPSNFLTDCSKLNSMVISPSITSIGINAFKNCINLARLTFFDISKIKFITFNTNCFLNVGNKSPISTSLANDLTIMIRQLNYLVGKNTLTNAGFYSEIIDIADGVNLIVENDIVINATRSSRYLNTTVKENIVVPLGITSIGTNAFSNVANYVNNVYLSNELLSIGSRAFNSNSLIDITIPSSVSSVGDYAFSGCVNLTNIVIQNSVIGNYMFQNCTGITSITIPSNVTSVGNYAFQGCTNLKFIYISNTTNPIFGTGVFQNCIKITNLDDYDSSIFGNFMFENCSGLVSANVYTNIINDGLFMNCLNLTSVSFPSVTNIGNNAFKGCSKLISIILPAASLTSIGDSAFENCIGLTDITIPSSVIDIGHSAFKNCSKLIVTNKSINITEIKPYTFYDIRGNNITITNDISTYKNYFEIDDTNNNFSYSLNYDDKLVYISATIGYVWTTKLKTYNVNIPNGLYTINDLNTILHVSFDSIGFYRSNPIENPNFDVIGAFYNSITDQWTTREYYVNFKIVNQDIAIVIDNISGIDGYILGDVFKIFPYTQRNSFNPVMNFPFGFSKLFGNLSSKMNFNAATNTFSTDLNLGGTNQYLGNTNQLTYTFSPYILHLPKKITSIGEYAFSKGKTYYYVNIPDSVTSIGDGAFNNSILLDVIIPPNVTSIGAEAFFNNSLKNITIPSSVISIGNLAFDANRLVNINLERIFRDFNNVTILGNNCFGSSNTYYLNTDKILSYNSLQFREHYFKGYSESDLFNAGFNNTDINKIATGTISFVIVNNEIVSATRKNYGTIAEAIIPGSITSIGNNVFANYNQNFNRGLYDVPANHLVSIDFGIYSKLSKIGFAAFSNCDYLTNITIPTTVTSLGSNVFFGCSRLTSIISSSNITSVGASAFGGCSSLQSIPNFITNKITNSMFYGCSSLKSVTITSNITSVGANAFEGCSGLTSINILNKNITTEMFKDCIRLKSVNIPLNVTSVGDNAFEGCSGLTSINILNKNISNSMFKGCIGLTSLIIPSTVTSVGDNAFEDCTGLSKLDENTFLNKVISTEMFKGCHGLTNVIIPSNITQVGELAFAFLNNLNYAKIDTDITGSNVFSDCLSLRKIDITNNCTKTGNYTFTRCKNLCILNSNTPVYINMPDSVTFIGASLFAECGFGANTYTSPPRPRNVFYSGPLGLGSNMFSENQYLESIVLNISKDTLANAADTFSYAISLKHVYFNIPGELHIPDRMFEGCSNLSFAIPSNVTSVGLYAFKYVKNIGYIPSSITKFGEEAFANISTLGSVTIFPTVTDLGRGVFYSCTNLRDVNIQNDKITSELFKNCNSITNLIISSSVTSVGEKAFEGCTGIKQLDETNILNKVIGTEMFKDCNNLTSITIPSSVTQIGDTAFFDCKGLTNITIKNSVIGSSMIRGCYALRNITIPPSVTSVGNYAFSPTGNVNLQTGRIDGFDPDESDEITSPNVGLTSVTIQNSVIGNNMFVYCHNLKNITIPSSITSVGHYAFFSCTRLTNINIQNNVISNNMFRRCHSLQNITIPSSVTSIGAGSFFNCFQLSNINLKKNYLNQLTPLGQNCFSNTIINNNNIKQLYFEGYLRTDLINAGINNDKLNNSIGDININIDNGILTDITSALGIPGVVLIPDSVTSISNNVFKTNKSIISYIYFNPTSSLVNISPNMFENCNLLTNITLPLNITNIGSNAFQSCSSLTNIIIPNKVINIGPNIFQDCSSLTSVTIPCAAIIDSSAFTSCNNIHVTICKGEISSIIKPNFLYSIPQITSITINNDITKIGSQSFYNCNKIKSINFKST